MSRVRMALKKVSELAVLRLPEQRREPARRRLRRLERHAERYPLLVTVRAVKA